MEVPLIINDFLRRAAKLYPNYGVTQIGAMLVPLNYRLSAADHEDIINHAVKGQTSVDFVDSLPRTATGKLQKFVIRERYWRETERWVH